MGQTILLADDDRLILTTLGEGLRQAGYEVREACDGGAAMQILEERLPDLAVLDVSMPILNGVEVAQHLRQNTLVPFIFLSAYCDDNIVNIAVEAGAHGYLVKPVDVAQLIPTIKMAIIRAAELRKTEEKEAHLSKALSKGRETSMAVGVLMERYRLSQQEAFEALRYHSRSQHSKLHDVAANLITASDSLNFPPSVISRKKIK